MEQVLALMCAHTFTASALHRRIGLLQAALEEVLFSSEPNRTTSGEAARAYLREHAAPEDSAAMCAWDDSFWEHFTAATLHEAIAELRRKAEALPSLTLYVPTELPEDVLSALCAWVRTQMHASTLLELHIDPNTIGGCAVVADDQYHDLSFHRALAKKSGIITKLLNTYA